MAAKSKTATSLTLNDVTPCTLVDHTFVPITKVAPQKTNKLIKSTEHPATQATPTPV